MNFSRGCAEESVRMIHDLVHAEKFSGKSLG